MKFNLSFEDALACVLDALQPIFDTEIVSIQHALGRVCAEDIAALQNHPAHDDSAVDGFACRRNDVLAGFPLELIGTSAAGSPLQATLQAGQAAKIFTGGLVPAGADWVVRVEHARVEGQHVHIEHVHDGLDIRKGGSSLQQGKVYLRAGQRIDASNIGLLAQMGHGQLQVVRRPLVGIITTGNELLEPGEAFVEGGVYNSNRYTLEAMIAALGAQPVWLGCCPDSIEALGVLFDAPSNMSTLEEHLKQHHGLDLLISSGGVSMGELDLVRRYLEECNAVVFWRANIQPGGPILLGQLKHCPILALPGNPVSTAATFWLFGKPAIERLLHQHQPLECWQAKLQQPTQGNQKTMFKRGTVSVQQGIAHVELWGNQSSGAPLSLAHSNVLVRIEPNTCYAAGDLVWVYPWMQHGIKNSHTETVN